MHSCSLFLSVVQPTEGERGGRTKQIKESTFSRLLPQSHFRDGSQRSQHRGKIEFDSKIDISTVKINIRLAFQLDDPTGVFFAGQAREAIVYACTYQRDEKTRIFSSLRRW